MFTDKQIDRYADVLLWGLKIARKKQLKKKDIVAIRFHLPAIRLAEVLHAKLLRMGINPVLRLNPTPDIEKNFYALSKPAQLAFQPPGEQEFMGHLNGSITLLAPESLTHLKDIDSRKISKTAIAQKHLRKILEKREAAGEFSWTLCMFPTPELAAQADLSLAEYSRQIIQACFLNKTSPISEWQRVFKSAREIKKRLNSMPVKFFHIESKNIDLKITPGQKRKWVGISGRNIPSFELYTSPDWRGTRGVYYADQVSFRSGNRVRGVRLEFSRGRAIKISAREGERFIKQQLSMDQGACRMGEFSLTDKRFSRIDRFMANTLFDENYGGNQGNCHIAMGSSYSNTFDGEPLKLSKSLKQKLGFNDSSLHWDLVNTEKKRVTAALENGGEVVIYENGKFVV